MDEEVEKLRQIEEEVHYYYFGLLHETLEDLWAACVAFHLAKDEFHFPAIEERRQGKKFVFSDYRSELAACGADDLRDYVRHWKNNILQWAEDYVDENQRRFVFFDPKFEFSEDHELFVCEFQILVSLLDLLQGGFLLLNKPLEERLRACLPKVGDPRIDYAVLRAVFHAGKMIEKAKQKGWKKSDWGRETGIKKRKTSPDDKSFLDAYVRAREKREKAPIKQELALLIVKQLEAMGYIYKKRSVYSKIAALKKAGIIRRDGSLNQT